MENKKYWFFGSKLNTALLLTLIILMVVALKWMHENKEVYLPTMMQEQSQLKQEEKISWTNSPSEFGAIVSYPSDWQITPQHYGSPGMMAQGGKDTLVGYSFRLPSGAWIMWGGPQSFCIDNEFDVFEYGVSNLACLRNLRTSIGYDSARKILSPDDLKLFGDFVVKNKE